MANQYKGFFIFPSNYSAEFMHQKGIAEAILVIDNGSACKRCGIYRDYKKSWFARFLILENRSRTDSTILWLHF